jgi:hypothetical protein
MPRKRRFRDPDAIPYHPYYSPNDGDSDPDKTLVKCVCGKL